MSDFFNSSFLSTAVLESKRFGYMCWLKMFLKLWTKELLLIVCFVTCLMKKRTLNSLQIHRIEKKQWTKRVTKHWTPLLISCLMEVNCNLLRGILKSSSSSTIVLGPNCEMLNKCKFTQVENCWNVDVFLLASISLVYRTTLFSQHTLYGSVFWHRFPRVYGILRNQLLYWNVKKHKPTKKINTSCILTSEAYLWFLH